MSTIPLDILKDVSRDFGLVIDFGTKFQIPVARQAGRERSDGLETICDRSLSVVVVMSHYHTCMSKFGGYFFNVIGESVSWYGRY